MSQVVIISLSYNKYNLWKYKYKLLRPWNVTKYTQLYDKETFPLTWQYNDKGKKRVKKHKNVTYVVIIIIIFCILFLQTVMPSYRNKLLKNLTS